MRVSPTFLCKIDRIVRSMAANQVIALADAMEQSAGTDWPAVYRYSLSAVPQPRFRAVVRELLEVWQSEAPTLRPDAVALMLISASHAIMSERSEQHLELIWTGPDSLGIPFRRTEQALLETIDAAQQTLLIVSFAVYLVSTLSTAIIRAADRGVTVRICAESSGEDGGNVDHNPVDTLGTDIVSKTQVYIWPPENRPVASSGKPASLHAKCAVADDNLLFLSSANLTGHAMAMNMELGVLVRGGPQPAQVSSHFNALMDRGVLKRI